ncbi:MAG: ribosomal L7Ae/L30e/S12e/Gadd45 family protein [Gemmatimonadales bacterium]|jgi:ribosomal protein L7Ae-like RNA K-turn-binding protein
MGRRSEKPEAADRFLKSLGLAAKAGRVRVGMDAVCQSIATGRAAAIVIAGDAPRSVVERLNGTSRPGGVVLDGDALGHAIGRERVVALAITDESLGRRVIELAESVSG